MSIDINLMRETYRGISLYSPNRTPAAIDLSDNTNLWGIPPNAALEIQKITSSAVTRYPALYVTEVKQAIANYLGVSPDMVVTGCGSDDVLDSAIRAFGNPGDVIAYPDPSFAMIPIFAKMNGVTPIAVPLTESFDLDVQAVLGTRAKMTYLCSPNNPTGTNLPRATIESIVDQSTGLVLIDEAYAEFSSVNCIDLLQRSSRVVIFRTFSKAFGLAGLRIGYAVGDPSVIAEIEKSRGPYKVNAVAERAAVAAMTTDRPWVLDRVRDAIEIRAQLTGELRALGLNPLPSEANFVLVPIEGAVRIDNTMRTLGVAVRPFSKLPGIGDALRISVGPWEMMEKCLTALKQAMV